MFALTIQNISFVQVIQYNFPAFPCETFAEACLGTCEVDMLEVKKEVFSHLL